MTSDRRRYRTPTFAPGERLASRLLLAAPLALLATGCKKEGSRPKLAEVYVQAEHPRAGQHLRTDHRRRHPRAARAGRHLAQSHRPRAQVLCAARLACSGRPAPRHAREQRPRRRRARQQRHLHRRPGRLRRPPPRPRCPKTTPRRSSTSTRPRPTSTSTRASSTARTSSSPRAPSPAAISTPPSRRSSRPRPPTTSRSSTSNRVKQRQRQGRPRDRPGQPHLRQGKYLGAEAQLSYSEIHSPINGVVTDRPLFAGETAAAGTPAVTVMDTSSLLAKLHLAQSQVQQLEARRRGQLTVPGIDDPVPAKVSLISPALDPGSTTVEVWLKRRQSQGRTSKPAPPSMPPSPAAPSPNAMLDPRRGRPAPPRTAASSSWSSAPTAPPTRSPSPSASRPATTSDPHRPHRRRHGHHHRRLRPRRRHQGQDRCAAEKTDDDSADKTDKPAAGKGGDDK